MAAVRAHITRYRTSAGYRYRVRITNRRLLKTAGKFNRAGFATRREAEQYARRVQPLIAQLEAGEVELGHTLGELIERYEADSLLRLNEKDRVVRRRQLGWWRHQFGGESPIATVTPPRISRALAELAKQSPLRAPRGKVQPKKADEHPLSPATVNRYRAALSALFTFAVKDLYWTEVNPLHYLTMVAGDNFRGVTSALPDLGRWSAVLAEFARCRDVPLEKPETDDLYRRLIETRKEAWGIDTVGETDHAVLQRLATECWPNDHLEKIAMDLARRKDLHKLMVEGDDEHLVKQVLDLAEAHYRMLWSISGKDERMVLYRLASNGFASWRGRELVRRLLHRGLIYLDPGPTLMNESFRQFVLGAELPEVFQLWTEEEGVSPWARLRMPVIVLVIGIFLFLFATQPQLFSQSLAFTTAIAAIVPTFIKLISIVGGSRSGSES